MTDVARSWWLRWRGTPTDERDEGDESRDDEGRDRVAGHADTADRGVRRGRGERGTAIITASVLLFTMTAAGILYLSRDVNRVVTNRSAAQSIAFQAARAGAQQVDVDSLRDGGGEPIEIDVRAAEAESTRVGTLLLDSYGLEGSVSPPEIDGDTVTISVTVIDRYGSPSATASVQAQTGP
jgi:hypothetical protein